MKSLEAIKARLEAATPGPWEDVYPNVDDGDIRVQVYHPDKRSVVHEADAIAWQLKPQDAEFIANSRTDIARLIKALKKAVEQRDKWLSDEVEAIADDVANTFRVNKHAEDKELERILSGEAP